MRKTVTIVFTDLVGSTPLAERLDPEAIRAVMGRYWEYMRAVLEQHGGTVEKFIGDAVMAVFGVPVLHEDDALRAVRATVDMRDALVELNTELEADWDLHLAIRTGVNTGEIFVNTLGTPEALAIGDAVNVAARLEQAAEPGQVLLGDGTYRLVRDAVEVDDSRALVLKGKSEPVLAYKLVRVIEGAAPFIRRFDSPLIGRRRELERLRRSFDQAVEDKVCVLGTVLGPPGVGKTRLASEFGGSLGSDAFVLTGHCLSYGEGTTFWPLREMFGELPDVSVEDLYWIARKRFEHKASDRPLLLVFDDLHWAETTLLDFIVHLRAWARDAPIFALGLARPEFEPRWAGDKIRLGSLGAPESESLLDALAPDLSRDQRSRILDRAEGNPLFLEQVLAWADEGDDAEVPPTLQALISARVDHLPDLERSLVQHAAVLGREFRRDALLALSPTPTDLTGNIQRLTRRDLIEPVGDQETYRFKQLLIRDGAYASIDKDKRSEQHGRAAKWLEQEGAADELIGYHLEQAFRYSVEVRPARDQERELARSAALRLYSAGQRVAEAGDVAAAVNLLERSHVLVPKGEREPGRLSISLASALVGSGDLVRAVELLDDTIDKATLLDDQALELHARIELALLRTHTGDERDMEEARITAEAAVPVFEFHGDELGLATAWATIGAVHHIAMQISSRHEAYERALEHARRAGDGRLERHIVMALAQGLDWGPMPVTEALRYCEVLLNDYPNDAHVEASCKVALGVLTAMLGNFNEGRALVKSAYEIWEERGNDVGIGRALESRRIVEMLAGDPAAAEEAVRPSYERLQRMGESSWLASRAGFLAESLAVQDRFAEAQQYVEVCRREATRDDAEAQALWRKVLARVEAERGDMERALRLARQAAETADRTDALSWRGALLLNEAEILRLAGRADDAARVARRALELFETKGDLVGAGHTRDLLRLIE